MRKTSVLHKKNKEIVVSYRHRCKLKCKKCVNFSHVLQTVGQNIIHCEFSQFKVTSLATESYLLFVSISSTVLLLLAGILPIKYTELYFIQHICEKYQSVSRTFYKIHEHKAALKHSYLYSESNISIWVLTGGDVWLIQGVSVCWITF